MGNITYPSISAFVSAHASDDQQGQCITFCSYIHRFSTDPVCISVQYVVNIQCFQQNIAIALQSSAIAMICCLCLSFVCLLSVMRVYYDETAETDTQFSQQNVSPVSMVSSTTKFNRVPLDWGLKLGWGGF